MKPDSVAMVPVRMDREKYRRLKHQLLDLDLTFNEIVNQWVDQQLQTSGKKSNTRHAPAAVDGVSR